MQINLLPFLAISAAKKEQKARKEGVVCNISNRSKRGGSSARIIILGRMQVIPGLQADGKCTEVKQVAACYVQAAQWLWVVNYYLELSCIYIYIHIIVYN